MRNPFEYGGVVGADAFCNRSDELKFLTRAIENVQTVFMYSERRMGKSSLVKQVLSNLDKHLFVPAYVDLWSTDSAESFALSFARGLTEASTHTVEKMLLFAKERFPYLVPTAGLDDSGRPKISFTLSARDVSKPNLAQVLEAPQRLAERTQKTVVMVLDEFQQILEYENDLVERQLRSSIQHQRNVAYIFLGSRKHLIQKMVIDKTRPFYRSGPHFPLGPIGTEHWEPFIKARFERFGKLISQPQINWICQLSEGHPFYTQHLCHALWELAEPGHPMSEDLLRAALELLLKQEDYAYSVLWQSLGLNQRRMLQGLAWEGSGATEPFSSAFVHTYGLRTASNVQRAIESLLPKDVIDQEGGRYFILDRFFKLWIVNLMSGTMGHRTPLPDTLEPQ